MSNTEERSQAPSTSDTTTRRFPGGQSLVFWVLCGTLLVLIVGAGFTVLRAAVMDPSRSTEDFVAAIAAGNYNGGGDPRKLGTSDPSRIAGMLDGTTGLNFTTTSVRGMTAVAQASDGEFTFVITLERDLLRGWRVIRILRYTETETRETMPAPDREVIESEVWPSGREPMVLRDSTEGERTVLIRRSWVNGAALGDERTGETITTAPTVGVEVRGTGPELADGIWSLGYLGSYSISNVQLTEDGFRLPLKFIVDRNNSYMVPRGAVLRSVLISPSGRTVRSDPITNDGVSNGVAIFTEFKTIDWVWTPRDFDRDSWEDGRYAVVFLEGKRPVGTMWVMPSKF